MCAKLLVACIIASISVSVYATDHCGGCNITKTEFTPCDEGAEPPTFFKMTHSKHPGEINECVITTSKKNCIEILEDVDGEISLDVNCKKGLLKFAKKWEGCDDFNKAKEDEDVQAVLGPTGMLEMECPPKKGKFCAGKPVDISKYKEHMSKGKGKSSCDKIVLTIGGSSVCYKSETEVACAALG